VIFVDDMIMIIEISCIPAESTSSLSMKSPIELSISAEALRGVDKPTTDPSTEYDNERIILVQSHGYISESDIPVLPKSFFDRSAFDELKATSCDVHGSRECMKVTSNSKKSQCKYHNTNGRRASFQTGPISFTHPESSSSIFDSLPYFTFFYDVRSIIRRGRLSVHHYSTPIVSLLVFRIALLFGCSILLFSPWHQIPSLSLLPVMVQAANSNYQSDYYSYYNNKNNGYYNYNKNYNYNYNNNKNDNGANNDASFDDAFSSSANDDVAQSNDDTAANDDASTTGDDANIAYSNANGAANNNGDDDFTDDYYGSDDDASAYNGDDNSYNKRNSYSNGDVSNNMDEQSYQYSDDDVFHWNQNVGFDGVSIMPLSCIN
jgi:hypothetical protein